MAEDMLERLIREAEAEGAPLPIAADASLSPSTEEPTVPTAAPATAPLAGLLSNPAVLSALPTLLGGLNGKGANTKKKPDRHTALLCAIKPYLGQERRQTADQLISLCRLWNTLEGAGLTRMLPALLGGASGGTADGTVPKEE